MSQYKFLIFLLLLLSVKPIHASEINWSPSISQGEVFEWQYEVYENGDHKTGNNISIETGSTVKIEILKDLELLSYANQTCETQECLLENINSSMIDEFFEMSINDIKMESQYVKTLLPLFIHPIGFINNSGDDLNAITSKYNIRETSNEYIYENSQTEIDLSKNSTIVWDKSGVMKYYNLQTQSFGEYEHIIISKLGYTFDTSDSILYNPYIVVPLLLLSYPLIRKYRK